ncbi:MAG: glycoside hydrolase family 30 beta sandwich domain-containing protein [Lacipirellulaceae bacterium]
MLAFSLPFAIAAGPSSAVDVWVTTADKGRLLAQDLDVVSQAGVGSGGVVVSINSAQAFQTMDGFGAAMTNSAAWTLQTRLTQPNRDRLMGTLFGSQDGIGLNYLRLAAGSSDFTASGFYTYNDRGPGQTDVPQANFSINPDRATILPALQQAKGANPDLKLMAAPWSPPGWMKTNNSVIGGSLRPEYYASYATYLRKFVEAYAAEGLPIDLLSVQNEPLHSAPNYPSSTMTATQQADLIGNHVGPAFAAAGLTTGLLAYDHNWDRPQYPIDVLNSATAKQYVVGSAFHSYAGSVTAQTTVRNAHPDRGIYFTEATGGDFAPNFGDNLLWYGQNLLVGVPRNWGKTVLLWNLALDQNGDPHLGGCTDCRGVVTVNNPTGAVTYNEEFYALGHASRFVKPGAVRIGSTTIAGTLETVAFRNPDGSEAMIAVNPTGGTQTLRAVRSGRNFTYTLPARSIATFTWGEGEAAGALDGADFANGSFEQGGFQVTGGSLDGWLPWGVVGGNVGVSTAFANDGEHSLRLSGQSVGGAGGGENFSGLSQGITVAPGDRVEASLAVLVPAAQVLAGGANVLMKIEYYSSYGGAFQSPQFLGQQQLTIADGATPDNAWRDHALVGTAPNGAVEARLVLVFHQPVGATGVLHVDSVAFAASAVVAGDYNGDGLVNAADYSVWRDALGSTTDLAADGDRNLSVDADDYAVWSAAYAAAGAPSSAIPEPAGLWAAAVVTLATRLRGAPSIRAR